MSQTLAQPLAACAVSRGRSAGRYRLGTAAIIVAAAALHLLGGRSVSLWDCDEAWYAQSSRQMLESGDWLVPRFMDQDRYAKPIFIYWCQATSMKLFGVSSASARLPSAVAVTLLLGILAVAINRAFGARRGMYTALIVATSMMAITSAKMCLTDSVLLLWITIAQLCLYAIYRGNRSTRVVVPMWVAIGLAGLTKGPYVLAILLSTMLALATLDVGRRWRSLHAWKQAMGWWHATRPLVGMAILAAAVAPWLIGTSVRNPTFLKNLLLEPIRHAKTNQSGGQPSFPGYHFFVIWITFFPWSLFLPAAIAQGWTHRRTPAIRFALASVLGIWVFVEVMITKLPHYFLPAYTSLAFLVSAAIMRMMRRPHTGMPGVGFAFGAAVWLLVTLALSTIVWIPMWFGFDVPRVPAIAFTAGGCIYAAVVFGLLISRRLAAGVLTMAFGLIAVLSILVGAYLPRAPFVRIPESAGTTLREAGVTQPGQVAMIGIHLFDPGTYPQHGLPSPSLAFYQGGTIRERPDDFLLREPPDTWPEWVVVTDKVYAQLPADRRAKLRTIASWRGFNYNIPLGVVEVTILRKIEEKP